MTRMTAKKTRRTKEKVKLTVPCMCCWKEIDRTTPHIAITENVEVDSVEHGKVVSTPQSAHALGFLHLKPCSAKMPRTEIFSNEWRYIKPHPRSEGFVLPENNVKQIELDYMVDFCCPCCGKKLLGGGICMDEIIKDKCKHLLYAILDPDCGENPYYNKVISETYTRLAKLKKGKVYDKVALAKACKGVKVLEVAFRSNRPQNNRSAILGIAVPSAEYRR